MRYLNYGLLLITLFLVSCHSEFETLQKDDNIYHLTTIEQLNDEKYSQEIEDFFDQGKEGFFTGKANISIYYKIFKQRENTNSAILISSGRTEATLKYKELIFDLYNNGYSIYIADHRGQGFSGRMTEDPDMGYIDTFQYYIDDMKYFYEHLLKPAQHKNLYLLSHSMGGAISMTYLEQYPKDFNAAAFSSPMLGFNPPICAIAMLLNSKNPKYAPGQGKYHYTEESYNENQLTSSEIRYKRMIAAYVKNPKARLGGATIQWLHKSCKQYKYINNNIENIQTPFILFSAENEQVVNTKSHHKFVEKAQKLGKTCKAFRVENSQHELLIGKDEQRIETINQILKFYKEF